MEEARGRVMRAFNPRSEKVETGGSLGLTGASLDELVIPRSQ